MLVEIRTIKQSYNRAGLMLTHNFVQHEITEAQCDVLKGDSWVEVVIPAVTQKAKIVSAKKPVKGKK